MDVVNCPHNIALCVLVACAMYRVSHVTQCYVINQQEPFVRWCSPPPPLANLCVTLHLLIDPKCLSAYPTVYMIKCIIFKQNIMTTGKISKNTPVKKRQISIEDFFGKDTKKVKTVNTVKSPASSFSSFSSSSSSATLVNNKSQNDLDLTSSSTKRSGPTQTSAVIKDQIKKDFSRSLDPQKLSLLNLELLTMEDSWFMRLQHEFKKTYFLELKAFLQNEQSAHTIFPPPRDIYSWTRLTPFDKVKVVIIGQDPYHNFNQAHGLAFSVKEPIPAPPSLKNIYKELKNNYPDFKIDDSRGDLSCWASQGVLLLNTSLTVRAHNANSHSNHGWEIFTSKVVELLIKDRENNGKNLVFLLWGKNATNLVENLLKKVSKENKRDWRSFNNLLILKSVHPSPLSANRGFFGNNHFKKINDWLYHEKKEKMIDWSVVPGSKVKEIEEKNNQI